MTGLFIKDILCLKKQFRMLLILFAFYAVVLVASGSHIGQFNAIFIALIVMIPMIVITNAFAYDEMSKWDIYSLSLPVTKSGIVLVKYLLLLLLACFGGFITLAVNAVSVNLNQESLISIYAAFGVAIVLCSVLIPLFYKFGTQKARIALMAMVMIPTMGVLILKDLKLPVPSDAEIIFWLKLSPVILVVFFIGSYFISCHIFENKNI